MEKTRLLTALAGSARLAILEKPFAKAKGFYRKIKNRKCLETSGLFPRAINIEITNDCNLSCIMCGRTYWNARPEDIKYMESDLVKKLVDEASGHETHISFFANGEPLLHRQLTEFIAYAKERGVKSTSINTNAMLLSHDRARELIDTGLDSITFSVDAIRPATYERIRRKGNYKTVEGNILTFLALRSERGGTRPIVTMQLVPMIHNYDEIEEYVDLWTGKLGKGDAIFLHQICPFDPAGSKGSHFRIGIFGSRLRRLKRLITRCAVGRPADACPIRVEDFSKSPPFYPCLSLWNDFYIPASGIVKVCWCSPDNMPRIFDIRKGSVEQIYNHEIYQKIRQLHLDGKKAGEDFKKLACHKCALWHRFYTKSVPYGKLGVVILKERSALAWKLQHRLIGF